MRIIALAVFFLIIGIEAAESSITEDLKTTFIKRKVFNDSIVRQFKIQCRSVNDSQISCRGSADGNKAISDSIIIHENDEDLGELSYYELTEHVFDDEDFLAHVFFYRRGWYTLSKYNHGRIVLFEKGCDTIQTTYKESCISEAKKRNVKADSLGRYVFYQERYWWDEKGRLQKRSVWNSGEFDRLNGIYTFVYGTPCDTVRVVPVDYVGEYNQLSDKGRYDGTFGKIPDISDPEYAEYAKEPYPSSSIFDRKNDSLLKRQQKRCEDYKKSLKKGNGKTR